MHGAVVLISRRLPTSIKPATASSPSFFRRRRDLLISDELGRRRLAVPSQISAYSSFATSLRLHLASSQPLSSLESSRHHRLPRGRPKSRRELADSIRSIGWPFILGFFRLSFTSFL